MSLFNTAVQLSVKIVPLSLMLHNRTVQNAELRDKKSVSYSGVLPL